jgi:uncharacterized protein YidB (DUF937 family)
MSRGFPSMTALLGLIAIAGYQNRDKLAELLRGAGGSSQNTLGGPGQGIGRPDSGVSGPLGEQQGGLGGLLGSLGGAGAAGGLGGLLGGGLGELVERFKQAGHGDVADSWVGTGPNRQVAPHDLENAIGPDVLEDLTRQTGLSREEILQRLSRDLPDAVDKYTPDGRLPT